jgi:hypothetical protein
MNIQKLLNNDDFYLIIIIILVLLILYFFIKSTCMCSVQNVQNREDFGIPSWKQMKSYGSTIADTTKDVASATASAAKWTAGKAEKAGTWAYKHPTETVTGIAAAGLSLQALKNKSLKNKVRDLEQAAATTSASACSVDLVDRGVAKKMRTCSVGEQTKYNEMVRNETRGPTMSEQAYNSAKGAGKYAWNKGGALGSAGIDAAQYGIDAAGDAYDTHKREAILEREARVAARVDELRAKNANNANANIEGNNV